MRRTRFGRFRNIDMRRAPHVGDVLRWKLGLGHRELPPLDDPRAKSPAACVEPDMERILRPDPAKVQLTFIGHATWLIQAAGVNLITDPMFSDDASPFPVPNIPRHSPPGIPLAKLPPVDAVILSHSHYDHLDVPSLRALKGVRECAAPLGVGAIAAAELGIEADEAAWGERLESTRAAAPFALTCLPAHHASARSLWDRDKTLWCGWLIEIAGRRIHFVGDTASADLFDELGPWLGGSDVALVPIGAYRPYWFMQRVHCDPAGAVRIHLAIRARRSLAMHWGMFDLADEPPGEPPLLLERAASGAGLAPGDFIAPSVGETVVL